MHFGYFLLLFLFLLCVHVGYEDEKEEFVQKERNLNDVNFTFEFRILLLENIWCFDERSEKAVNL